MSSGHPRAVPYAGLHGESCVGADGAEREATAPSELVRPRATNPCLRSLAPDAEYQSKLDTRSQSTPGCRRFEDTGQVRWCCPLFELVPERVQLCSPLLQLHR